MTSSEVWIVETSAVESLTFSLSLPIFLKTVDTGAGMGMLAALTKKFSVCEFSKSFEVLKMFTIASENKTSKSEGKT